MLAIVGALAIALAAMTMLLAAVLVRHPAVPAVLKGDAPATALSLLVTTLFGAGVTMIAMMALQTAAWQLAVAVAIVAGGLAFSIFALRKFARDWQSQPPKAPVVVLPRRNKAGQRKAVKRQAGKRHAA